MPTRLQSGALLLRRAFPSARILLLTLCIAKLLMCSGDIEANPGPGPKEGDSSKLDLILQKLNTVISDNARHQKETTDKLNELSLGIGDLTRRVSSLESSVGKIKELQNEIKKTNDVVTEIERKIEDVSSKQQDVSGLSDIVDNMNNQMRRNNLLIKGIPEEGNESWAQTERIALSFFSDRLQLNVGDIERAHRVGRKREGFNRPIIVKFLSFKSKRDVLHGASRLRSTDTPRVWIEEDYSPKVRKIRKKLWDYAKSVRTTRDGVNLAFDKLFINNQMYVYCDETDSVLPASRERRTADAPRDLQS